MTLGMALLGTGNIAQRAFVPAVQQQRPPRATLEDGLRNVYIMEIAREGSLQRPL